MKRNPPERSILGEQQTKTTPSTNTAVTLSCAQSESTAASHSSKLFSFTSILFFFYLKSVFKNASPLAAPSSLISVCRRRDSSLIASIFNLCANKPNVDICSEVGQNQIFEYRDGIAKQCDVTAVLRKATAKDTRCSLSPSRC